MVNDRRDTGSLIKRVLQAASMGHCVKAALLALVGLLNTRMLVGIGRFQQNLVFVPFIYLCIAIAGMLLVHAMRLQPGLAKVTRIACVIAIGAGIGLSIWYGTAIEQVEPVIVSTVAFCVAWIILPLVVRHFKRDTWIIITMTSSTYAGGLLFGMLVNAYELPLYIYFMVAGFFLLVFYRELVKDCIQQPGKDADPAPSRIPKRYRNRSLSRFRSGTTSTQLSQSLSSTTYPSPASTLGVVKAIRLGLYIVLVAIGCLVTPIFTGVWNYALYTYSVVPACFVLCVASYRAWKAGAPAPKQLAGLRKHIRAAFVLVVLGLVLQFIF